jgi:hypothetical protein
MIQDSRSIHRGIHQIASLTKPGSGAGPWNTPGPGLRMRAIFPPIYIEHNGTGERDLTATGLLCARNQPRRGFGVRRQKIGKRSGQTLERYSAGNGPCSARVITS